MRAALLQAAERVVVADVPPPEPDADQVRVRLEGAGICASELPLWQGRSWFEYPRIPGEPGHEGWGRIDALGAGVEGLEVGQRVAMISQRAHAEFDVCAAEHLVVLPPAIDRGQPFPGEPLACAVNAAGRAGLAPGQRVAVIGMGFMGLVLVQLCAGVAGELAAVSRRPGSLAVAESLGATTTWRMGDPLLERQPPYDIVFEATGYQDPLDLAGRIAAVRGTLVIVGYHQDGRRSVDMQLWNWRGLDVINAHERDPAVYVAGLREAVHAWQEGRLDPAPLLTHRYALEDLAEAYRVSVERPEGFVKAVWCER